MSYQAFEHATAALPRTVKPFSKAVAGAALGAIGSLAGLAGMSGLTAIRPSQQLPNLQIETMHTLVALAHTKVHGVLAADRAAALDPAVAARIAQGGANLAHLLADPVSLMQHGAASILASSSAHLFLTLTALLLAGWRAAQCKTISFTPAGEHALP
ncbi:MAG: hypothetical protein ACJ8HI_14175 [Massilia sp.]